MVLGLLLSTNAFAKPGKGELQLEPWAVDYFIKYLRGKHSEAPELFIISKDSSWAIYYYCPDGPGNCAGSDMHGIKACERKTDTECALFARGRSIKWKNGINPGKGKASRINSKWSDAEIKAKLTELGFYGNTATAKKYSSEGERTTVVSWEGYSDMIVGTLNFSETDYEGIINLVMPNNDGTCEGSYSLQLDGKGTWQVSCTNNMGAAGTLEWKEGVGVKGIGRDYNDKKVKFAVSSK